MVTNRLKRRTYVLHSTVLNGASQNAEEGLKSCRALAAFLSSPGRWLNLWLVVATAEAFVIFGPKTIPNQQLVTSSNHKIQSNGLIQSNRQLSERQVSAIKRRWGSQVETLFKISFENFRILSVERQVRLCTMQAPFPFEWFQCLNASSANSSDLDRNLDL